MKTFLQIGVLLAWSVIPLFAQQSPVQSNAPAIKSANTNGPLAKTPEVAPLSPASEDVVRRSVRITRMPPDRFVVSWTYTDVGAAKALAAWEKNPTHKPMSPESKAAWLKKPMDKFFFRTATAAKEFFTRLSKE